MSLNNSSNEYDRNSQRLKFTSVSGKNVNTLSAAQTCCSGQALLSSLPETAVHIHKSFFDFIIFFFYIPCFFISNQILCSTYSVKYCKIVEYPNHVMQCMNFNIFNKFVLKIFHSNPYFSNSFNVIEI